VTSASALQDSNLVTKQYTDFKILNPVSEPTVTTVTSASLLTDNNLVTKQYTDFKILNPVSEPTVTTVTSASLLTDNNLVTKQYTDYKILHPTSEPIVDTITTASLLTDNNLTSKKYVDDKIAEIQNNYPQVYTLGKALTSNGSSMILPTVQSGFVYLNFIESKSIQKVYLDICYHITRCNAYTPSGSNPPSFSIVLRSTTDSTYPSYNYHSVYEVVFIKSTGTGNFTTATANNLDGDNITSSDLSRVFGSNWFTWKPIVFGLSDGRPVIRARFPSGSSYNISSVSIGGWICSYGCTLRILSSNPNNSSQSAELTTVNSGNAYFSNV